jgi:hypothetical protein
VIFPWSSRNKNKGVEEITGEVFIPEKKMVDAGSHHEGTDSKYEPVHALLCYLQFAGYIKDAIAVHSAVKNTFLIRHKKYNINSNYKFKFRS